MIELTQKPEKALILIVEDEPSNAIIISSALYETFISHHVSSGQEALDFCKSKLPDLILMDINMMGMDGLTACRHLKSQTETKDIPVVFITASTDLESEDECWEAGCTDFIAKPFSTNTLRRRINAHVSAKLMTDQLKRLATIDGLTNLQNRRFFDGFIADQIALSNRSSQQVSLLLIDIDYYKQYNDNYGHLQGDDILRCVAETLSIKLQRPTDNISRYGGGTFAAVLPDTHLAGAEMLAKQLQIAVRELKIPHSTSPHDFITVSVGGAVGIPVMTNETDLIARADANLFFAKHAGRNIVLVE